MYVIFDLINRITYNSEHIGILQGEKFLVRKIDVDAFLDYLGEGVTEPALILGSDSQRYIMKKQMLIEHGKGNL